MRLTSIEMYSANFDNTIEFNLKGSGHKGRYSIRTIAGLDAEEIIPKFYGNSLNADSKFYDYSMKPRDIVMRLILNPRFRLNESYSDVRDELYKLISSNRSGLVTLYFKSGTTVIASTVGAIIKFESVYFEKLPEVQLTIRCPDPMFRGVTPVVFTDAALPTANPIEIADSLSTAPHGFTMQFSVTSSLDDSSGPEYAAISIQDLSSSPNWKFQLSGSYSSGDVIYLSSEYSNKYIYKINGGVTTELADKIKPGSIWPVIFPGLNSFHIPQIASIDLDDLRYYPSYWGV